MASTDSSTGRPRPRRCRRTAVVTLVVFILVMAGLGVLGWRVVYRPTIDRLPDEPADVLMVLGPLDSWRVPEAERLMRQHRARNLVLSTPNMPWDAMYCQQKHPWPAYCFPPDPSTTRGEAMGLRRLMRQHGWHSVIVLTVDFHVDRARFIFERCLRQPVVATGPRLGQYDRARPFQTVYQVAGFLKEVALGRCPA